MSSTPNRRSLLGATALTGFDPIILEFTDDLRHRGGAAEGQVPKYRYAARHFLIWLELAGIELKTVDGTVIERFLQHDCRCAESSSAPAGLNRWRKCRSSPKVMTFIRFLERTGRIETPGELDDNFRLLDAFLAGLRRDGYATATIKLYRYGCGGLIVWLHLSRLRLYDLSPEVIARFRRRRIVCSIPGVFCGHESRCPETAYEIELRSFVKHLVSIGRIEPFEPVLNEKTPSPHLARFADWLERHRASSPEGIRQYVRLIGEMLPGLGDDPGVYNAALLRRVLFDRMEPWSQGYARKLTTAMRMYLRFLVSEGSIAAALVEAVPTVPQWRLAGLRDRAMLHLCYAAGLRVSELTGLTLDSLSGPQLETIRILGKGRRERELPLWKETKTALNEWLDVRPPVSNRYLFLNARGRALSTDGFAYILDKHVATAARKVPSIKSKRVTPHVLRHSTAMTVLHATRGDIRKVSIWLGHADVKTTEVYLRASPAEKMQILEANAPPSIRRGTFNGVQDSLMTVLSGN